MSIRFRVIIFILLLAVFSQSSLISQPRGMVPNTLENMAIKAKITSSASPVFQENQFQRDGELIVYFEGGKLFYDSTKLFGNSIGGDYTFKKLNPNRIEIISSTKHSLGENYISLRIILDFSDKNSGNIVVSLFNSNDFVLQHSGTFAIAQENYSFFSDSAARSIFTFFVDSDGDGKSEVTGSTDNTLEIYYDQGRKFKLVMNGEVTEDRNLTLTREGLLKMNFSGGTGKNEFSLTLDFESRKHGEFKFLTSSTSHYLVGNFTLRKYTHFNENPLKGNLTDNHFFPSKILNVSLPYHVYLPPGYASSNRKYPVLYATDGQWHRNFAYALDYYGKEVVFVAVEQGDSDRRMIDYQPPGAYEYIKFLKKEFIPYIERQYRVTDSRSFYGASIGGVVGGILIGDERESPCFKNYILADGAMSLVSKSDIFNGNNIPIGSRPVNVFLTGTLQGNGVSVKNYAAELKENSLGNTRILYKQYELSHEEMGLPTLIEFIDELD